MLRLKNDRFRFQILRHGMPHRPSSSFPFVCFRFIQDFFTGHMGALGFILKVFIQFVQLFFLLRGETVRFRAACSDAS